MAEQLDDFFANLDKPKEKSPSEIVAERIAILKQHRAAAAVQHLQALNAGFDMVWGGQGGITAKQMIEGMGTDAVRAFKEHKEGVEYLASHDPRFLNLVKLPPDWAVLTNEVVDGVETGRVILTEKPKA